ncbi:hypothetical protein H6F61_23945 [Cyanobacteria bacterium FACHB-472]|nr:hypothetical protein [Cyanobacteria bacterium FACHB-472]
MISNAKNGVFSVSCIPELRPEALAVMKFSSIGRGWQWKLAGCIALGELRWSGAVGTAATVTFSFMTALPGYYNPTQNREWMAGTNDNAQVDCLNWICCDVRNYWLLILDPKSDQVILQAFKGNKQFRFSVAEGFALQHLLTHFYKHFLMIDDRNFWHSASDKCKLL